MTVERLLVRRRSGAVQTGPSSPVCRLSAQKRPYGSDVALVAEEVCLLLPLGPEPDGVGEGVHSLAVSADERPAKVDVLDLVLFRLEIGDLSDIVAVRVSTAA